MPSCAQTLLAAAALATLPDEDEDISSVFSSLELAKHVPGSKSLGTVSAPGSLPGQPCPAHLACYKPWLCQGM